jgi:phosphomevalonate kinase
LSIATVFAPGKMFVTGEYAVLSGARALVAALDAGIIARAERATRWNLQALDLGVDGPLEDAAADSRAALLARAIDAGRGEHRIDTPLAITVEGAHPASKRKYGLGGSAASVVAVLGTFAAFAGEDLGSNTTRDRLFATAFRVHREHQRGRGSGADVAASVYGGWLDYSLAEGGSRIVPAAMPDGVCLAAVWSGVASDTVRAIDAFEAPRAARLRAVLERFWSGLLSGQVEAIGEAITAYGAVLEEIGGDGEGARRIRDLVAAARAAGFAAKGSGAVGGDSAIAIGFGAADVGALHARWRAMGGEPLDVALDQCGVRALDGRNGGSDA